MQGLKCLCPWAALQHEFVILSRGFYLFSCSSVSRILSVSLSKSQRVALREGLRLIRGVSGRVCMRGGLWERWDGVVVPLRCKSFTCPFCCIWLVLKMLAALKLGRSYTLTFVTLTFRPGTRWASPTGASPTVFQAKRCWATWGVRMRKDCPMWLRVPWLKVLEYGDDGRLHFHLVVAMPGGWDYEELKAFWVRHWGTKYSGIGDVSVEFPRSRRGAMWYLCGYLTVFAKHRVGNVQRSRAWLALLKELTGIRYKDRGHERRWVNGHGEEMDGWVRDYRDVWAPEFGGYIRVYEWVKEDTAERTGLRVPLSARERKFPPPRSYLESATIDASTDAAHLAWLWNALTDHCLDVVANGGDPPVVLLERIFECRKFLSSQVKFA